MNSRTNKDGQYIYTKQQIQELNRKWGNDRIINANDYYNLHINIYIYYVLDSAIGSF